MFSHCFDALAERIERRICNAVDKAGNYRAADHHHGGRARNQRHLLREREGARSHLVGEENNGWTYAKFLLGHERTNNAGIGNCKRGLRRLKEIAAAQMANGRPLIEDRRFRDRITQVELELMALEITNLRVLSAASESRAPGPEVSLLKIKGSEIIQQLAELQMHALGHDALPYLRDALEADWVAGPLLGEHYAAYAPPLSGQYFNQRKTTIYAGSTEIQKNIIAKMVLGL